jgi:four helix bundle protein
MRSRFRDLGAYRLAASLADELHGQVGTWPPFERWSVGLQLVRAADSVAADIAGSSGRWSTADKRRLLVIARGSLCETEHWLERAEARGLPAARIDRLQELAWALAGPLKRPTPPN